MNDVLVDIVSICVDIAKSVKDFYSRAGKKAEDLKTREFFISLSREKEAHLAYLHKVLVFAKQQMILQVFSRPFQVKEELKDIKARITTLMEKSLMREDLEDLFITSFYSEFQLLHEAFICIYQVDMPKAVGNPLKSYEAYIIRFGKMINNIMEGHLVLQTLRDGLEKLWKATRLSLDGNMADALTGVLNRQGFLHKISPWLELLSREKKACAVFMIDIDHLKNIHDDSNTRTGDRVIMFVANQLKNLCRKSDILGRYSGQEFIVFLPIVDNKNLQDIAERFRKRIEEKSSGTDMSRTPVTISIGAVYGCIRGRDLMAEFEKFINAAVTVKLHKVKRSGGNGVALLRIG